MKTKLLNRFSRKPHQISKSRNIRHANLQNTTALQTLSLNPPQALQTLTLNPTQAHQTLTLNLTPAAHVQREAQLQSARQMAHRHLLICSVRLIKWVHSGTVWGQTVSPVCLAHGVTCTITTVHSSTVWGQTVSPVCLAHCVTCTITTVHSGTVWGQTVSHFSCLHCPLYSFPAHGSPIALQLCLQPLRPQATRCCTVTSSERRLVVQHF
jgi:hypothetical protein